MYSVTFWSPTFVLEILKTITHHNLFFINKILPLSTAFLTKVFLIKQVLSQISNTRCEKRNYK